MTARPRKTCSRGPPTTPPGQPGGPYTAPSTEAANAYFCFHWVESGDDAPPGSDGNLNTIPPYIQEVANVFGEVIQREHGDLEWREPISDGALGGCTWDGKQGRTDIYLKDLGQLGLYGYAAPDPGQSTQNPYAFMVMDDDYAEYGYDDPQDPLEVTAAHEYNHVLQFAYDVLQDKWMFESTATWMEEKVYPEIDDYLQYVGPWSQLSTMPLTRFDRQQGDKVYGSAVFNRWLDDEYDETIVRRAWELSFNQDSFAPGAYDKAIREYHGPGFSYELANFAASTAEWKTAAAGVHEGAKFPDVKRIEDVTLPTDGSVLSGKLDHTTYALFDVAKTNAPKLKLTGSLPAGTAGAVMLVARKGSQVRKTTEGVIPTGGVTSVTLDDPGSYERITAVVVNGSYDKAGWNGTDWNWTRDQQAINVAATALTGDGGGDDGGDDGGDGGTTDPGTGGGSTSGGSSTPGGGGSTPSTLLQLKLGAAPRLAKAKALTLTAASGRAGTLHGDGEHRRRDGEAPAPRPPRAEDRHGQAHRRRGRLGHAQGRAHGQGPRPPEALRPTRHGHRADHVQGRRRKRHDPHGQGQAQAVGKRTRGGRLAPPAATLSRAGGWNRVAYCDHVRGMRRALPFLIVLARRRTGAGARPRPPHPRARPTKALERAQRLADGRGVRTGRELSAALQQVAAQRSDLSSTQRAAGRPAAGPADRSDGRRARRPLLAGCDGRDATARTPTSASTGSRPTNDAPPLDGRGRRTTARTTSTT